MSKKNSDYEELSDEDIAALGVQALQNTAAKPLKDQQAILKSPPAGAAEKLAKTVSDTVSQHYQDAEKRVVLEEYQRNQGKD